MTQIPPPPQAGPHPCTFRNSANSQDLTRCLKGSWKQGRGGEVILRAPIYWFALGWVLPMPSGKSFLSVLLPSLLSFPSQGGNVYYYPTPLTELLKDTRLFLSRNNPVGGLEVWGFPIKFPCSSLKWTQVKSLLVEGEPCGIGSQVNQATAVTSSTSLDL